MSCLTVNRLILFFALPMLAFWSGCKSLSRTDASYSPGFVMGENDIKVVADVDIDSLPIARKIFAAVSLSSPMIMVKLKKGRQTGARFCSGILLAGEGNLPKVLTNQHCFKQNPADLTQHLLPNACEHVVVYFDKSDAKKKRGRIPKLERECKRGSLRTSFDGDLATFTLDKPLPAAYTYAKIWEEDEVPTNRGAFVLHYPSSVKESGIPLAKIKGGHKGKAPQKTLTVNECRILERFPPELLQRPQARPAGHRLRYSVRHTCDLVGGSSGAALLDVETGKVLALHFGSFQVESGRGVIGFNTATHAMHLRQFLAGEKLTLP